MSLRSRLKCEDEDLTVRFINLMSYKDWPKRNLSDIEQHMFPMILMQWSESWLCWLSGRSLQTLEYFLQYQAKQRCSGHFVQRYAFIRAVVQNHFIDDITHENSPIDVRRALFISNLVDSSDSLSVNKIDEQLYNTLENGFTKSLSYELKRLYLLSSSLTYFVPKFASCFNAIDALAKELDFAYCNPETINTILLENYRNNQHIPLLMTTTTEPNSECDLFEQFMVIRLCLEIILDRNIDTQTKLKDLKNRLRNITSKTAYIEALETSFSLLFMRWEHVDHDREQSSSNETSDNSNSTDKRRMHQQKIDNHGFVCTMDHVEAILKMLRMSINQKKHSDDISDAFKERFSQISEHINDAAWRLTLFGTLVNLKRLPIDTKKYLTMHNTPKERKSSSDEDDSIEIERKCDKKLTARKPRKRLLRKLECGKQSTTPIDSNSNSSNRRCIISKMLGSPQHLLTHCMNKVDTESSRQIIKVSLIFIIILYLHSFPNRLFHLRQRVGLFLPREYLCGFQIAKML